MFFQSQLRIKPCLAASPTIAFFVLLFGHWSTCHLVVAHQRTDLGQSKKGKENSEIKLELASPFADRAVIQQGMKAPIWGWANAGEKVIVRFAGQTKEVIADERGKWMVVFDPLKASADGRELLVQCNSEKIVRKDILVGEVWFSSGQSNMDWIAGKSMCRDLAGRLQRAKQEIPIREFNVDIGSSIYPQSRAASADGWKSSKKASSFSALSLAFAWSLYEELSVPIGIVRSTHGATPIETWTAYEGFAKHPALAEYALRIKQNNPTTDESRKAFETYVDELNQWQRESEKLIDLGGQALPRPKLPGIAEDWKGPSRMFNKKIAPLVPYAIRGAIWCQGTSNSNDGKIYADKMAALVDGWRIHWKRPNLPFCFTQMQCYGEPNKNNVGFADIREAQTKFFRDAKNVGMVPQYDLNPARPTGIHYYNKLDPGKRMARWAMAKVYGKKVAFTGPLYRSHSIKGNQVWVTFEKTGLDGGLMVASKGMESDAAKNPDSYVEPARETKNVALNHFRVAGKDKIWHDAEAFIEGNKVVVQSPKVANPVGVQYAYSASPVGANLYNRAGLPAVPFAYFDGKQMFNEDDPKIVAAAKVEAERKWGKKTYLLPSTLLRDRAVLQRERPVPVWGHGVPGTEITVTFAGQKKTTKVDSFEKWRVTLDPMPAKKIPTELKIDCSNGESRIIKDVLVGDVWFITGGRQLASELIRPDKEKGTFVQKALPLVREFRIKTKARRFRTPRKLRMEIGGGKYVASWQPADFDDVGDPPSVAAYYFATRAREQGIPLGIVTLGAENPPLTWISPEALQTAKGFESERDNLNLGFPNTDVCKQAVKKYIQTIQEYNIRVAELLQAGKEVPIELSDSAPSFPEPYYNQWASRTETATHTYNFCISPLVPFAIRGVVWIPTKDNISEDASKYSPALAVFANNLARTFGQPSVEFVYGHPSPQLVNGISDVPLSDPGKVVHMEDWPKSMKLIAWALGSVAAERF